jgi:hypothetical protein
MRETDANQLCFTAPLSTINRTIICIVMIVLITMLNPERATAGVVIEQRITISAPGEPGSVRNRRLMLQGDMEKFQINDQASVVIDATNRTATMLDYANKTFRELPSESVIGTTLDPNDLLYIAFKGTDQTRDRLGYKCRNYTGVTYDGPTFTATTACFSTNAAGSDDFSHFIQSIVGRYGRAMSVPAGVPLIIESTRRGNLAFSPPGLSAKEAVRFKNIIAKIPPQVTRVEVTKITSEKLSPDVFKTPAGYARSGPGPN